MDTECKKCLTNVMRIFIKSNSAPSVIKKKLGFTPSKAEQPLQGMELQEKEAQKD